ncbi:MAG: ABC transporter substrate-binding protein [Chloroflexi bacterium]|nr:ABC transporter substrate-binding protein [Chloroflexota bacterium]
MIPNRVLWLAFLLVMLVLNGCYLHRSEESLHIAVAAAEIPQSLDPHHKPSAASRYVHAAIFDALTTIDEKGEVKPSLARSWKSLGPTTWEFKLRQGARFQNGEGMNAQAVGFNIRRVLRPEFRAFFEEELSTLFRGNPLDPETIVISTRRPDPIFPRRLASLYLVPPDYTTRVGDTKFGEQPVGTGPWAVKRFHRASELTLEAVRYSWRGRPQVRYIELRQDAEAAVRVEALEQGMVEVALGLPPSYRQALSSRGFRVEELPKSAARLIILDTTDDESPLVNAKVRQALNYAVDKQKLISKVAGGGIPLDGQVVGKEANGYSDKVKTTYPYDLAEAQRLMDEAGYGDGFDLTIHYTKWPDDSERRELAEIADDLAKIKVRVVPKGDNRAVHERRRAAGSLSPAFYDTFPYYPTQDAAQVMDWFGPVSTETFSPTYDFDEFEEIYKLSRTEQNPALRLQSLQVAMRILSEHPPAIFLYQPTEIHARQQRILDFRALPSLLVDFDRINKQ